MDGIISSLLMTKVKKIKSYSKWLSLKKFMYFSVKAIQLCTVFYVSIFH